MTTNRILSSGFLKSVLHNGVGRYVCQLKRITFKFCKTGGGSKGMRDFIETELIDFARKNPGVVIYLQPRRHRGPVLSAEYLNGHRDWLYCNDFTCDEVTKWLEYMRTKSGFPIVRLRKFGHTDIPSIQGVWTPFTNKPTSLNLSTFPDEERSAYKTHMLSATEQLELIKKEQQTET